jgi:hypothetical protein
LRRLLLFAAFAGFAGFVSAAAGAASFSAPEGWIAVMRSTVRFWRWPAVRR